MLRKVRSLSGAGGVGAFQGGILVVVLFFVRHLGVYITKKPQVSCKRFVAMRDLKESLASLPAECFLCAPRLKRRSRTAAASLMSTLPTSAYGQHLKVMSLDIIAMWQVKENSLLERKQCRIEFLQNYRSVGR